MAKRLAGKGAVVTGAGRGIGQAVAMALAAEGASVVVADLGVGRDGSGTDLAPADEVVKDIKKGGGKAVSCFESVADFAAAEKLIKSCVDSFGRIDILVNCAGVLRERMIWNMSEDDWDTVLAVHLKGTFNTCRHASAYMREQRFGRIVNFTSDAWKGTVGQANYGAAKGGMVSFTRSIARELGKYNITCNCVAPVASTRMTMDDGVKAGLKKRLEAGLISKEQYGTLMDLPGPEFVAPIVVYLAADEEARFNGQVLGAGGGRVALFSEPVEAKGIYRDYKKDGPWTVDELEDLIPKTLSMGLVNPAPPMAAEK
ncbi:SDR family NAD(P)-dependent oxidoreductase [Chloroflexota bacterium]